MVKLATSALGLEAFHISTICQVGLCGGQNLCDLPCCGRGESGLSTFVARVGGGEKTSHTDPDDLWLQTRSRNLRGVGE